MAERTIFDYLNAINYKKEIPYDKKIANSYMLSMWLSHDVTLIDIVNDINRFQFSLPDELIYKYYYSKIPMGKRYLKWTKKEETDKKMKDKVDKFKQNMLLSKLEINKYKEFVPFIDDVKAPKQKKAGNASSIFL